jgi:hypothetical protein
MLKPYICVACERVLIEQAVPGSSAGASGVPSLIGLFSKIIAVASFTTGSEIQEIPHNAVVPKDWAIFSQWDIEPGDEKRQFVICTQIFYPDESPFGPTSKIPLKIEAKAKSQNVIRISGFPIGQAGFYKVRTWIEENDREVLSPIEFKIELEFQKQEQIQTVVQ